jgi:hypothetical protein
MQSSGNARSASAGEGKPMLGNSPYQQQQHRGRAAGGMTTWPQVTKGKLKHRVGWGGVGGGVTEELSTKLSSKLSWGSYLQSCHGGQHMTRGARDISRVCHSRIARKLHTSRYSMA